MSLSSPPATLVFYRRDECALCDEARDSLQVVLEQRALRGDPVPRLRVINLTEQPELEDAFGARVPVLAIDGDELSLATSARQISTFLDRTLGRLV